MLHRLSLLFSANFQYKLLQIPRTALGGTIPAMLDSGKNAEKRAIGTILAIRTSGQAIMEKFP